MDEDMKNFLAYWFSGFSDGLDELDDPARETILRRCGEACARSYTADIFREVMQETREHEAFLEALGERFPGCSYNQIAPDEIEVTYDTCGCDLVRLGWVKSPAMCMCSAHNLRANLEAALDFPVTVTLQKSILRGDDQCVFVVKVGSL